FEGYLDGSENEFAALEAKLTHDVDRSLDKFRPEISQYLASEILRRYYYQKGASAYQLKHDQEMPEAIKILNDQNTYNQVLSGKALKEE
ncbi:MAG: S41 family peptidase, partial [Bacteroidales bacterium]